MPSQSRSSASQKQQYGFVCMSTVDDLSYTPSELEKSRDAAQIEVTGRRSWKTLRGKGEAVWPPLLENAILEALEKYSPEAVGSRSGKSLGRFPMRNKFISDYIYKSTGKKRTPKQVGSRLQQLRDTCKGDKIFSLISRSHRDTPEPTSSSSQSEYSQDSSPSPSPVQLTTSSQSEYSQDSSPSPSPFQLTTSSQSEYSQDFSPSPPPVQRAGFVSQTTRTSPSKPITVYVEVTLEHDMWTSASPSIHFIGNSSSNPQMIRLDSSATARDSAFMYDKPSGPTVEFPSSTSLNHQSTFIVYRNGSPTPFYTESSQLACVSSPIQRSGWLYSSELVPGFWNQIRNSLDPSKYTVLQRLKPMSSRYSGNLEDMEERYISIVYTFTAPPRAYNRRHAHMTSSPYPTSYISSGPSFRPLVVPRSSAPSPVGLWTSSILEPVVGESWSPVTNTINDEYFGQHPMLDTSQPCSYSQPTTMQQHRYVAIKEEGEIYPTQDNFETFSSFSTSTHGLHWPSDLPPSLCFPY